MSTLQFIGEIMFYDSKGGRHATVTEEGIYGFFDEYRFLSNFHVCNVVLDGLQFASSEAAYMACKTDDRELKYKLALMENPSDAKKFGRELDLRIDWDELKTYHMTRVLFAKFKQNDDLLALLHATGNLYLEETNDWSDRYWGANQFGAGHNMLGKILMIIRETI